MSARSFVAVAICLLPFGLARAFPQDPVPPPPPPPASGTAPQDAQGPVFRAGIDLVRIDVSVLDKDHKPVHGLTAADFTIREDTKPQTIEAFSEVVLPDPVEPAAKWMKKASPDVSTNDLHDSRIVVIVIDDAVIPDDRQMVDATKKIAHSVIDHLGETDLTSVIYTNANRQKTQDFTSDKAKLLAAVDKFTPGFSSFGADADDYLFFQYSINVVHDVADYLVALPQRRKTLIYISPGVPVDPSAGAGILASGGGSSGQSAVSAREEMLRLYDDLRETFQRAQQANVAIYPVDPAGPGEVENYVFARLIAQRVPAPAATEKAHQIAGFALDNLLEHADNTGGRATVNTTDYTEGINQIFRENGSYYLLGFRQTDPKGPGKFSRLDVKVDRPDVEVRSRKINYTPKPETALAKASAVTRALSGLLPSPDTPMRVSAAPFLRPVDPEMTDKERKAAYGDATVAIVLGVDEPAPKERVVEHVDLLTRAFNDEGDPRGSQNQTADVTIKAATPLPGQPPPFTRYEVLTQIALKPGRYSLRLAVDNAEQSKTGSVFVDVEVPDFLHLPLSLSGVVVDSINAPYAAPKDALQSVVPIVPTTDREFETTGKARAFLRVYQGVKGPALPITMTTSILDEHDAKVASADSTIGVDQFTAGTGAEVTFDLPLDTLKPGTYLLMFDATNGKQTAHRDLIFAVR